MAFALTASGCIDTASLAVNSTSKVLVRAQPSMRMESDFDMARMAIPASLKTIEGFHVAQPDNERLIAILAEGYCQYGTGFIEDDWEQAYYAKDYDGADYQAKRATKAYTRCMNYALRLLPPSWEKTLVGGSFDEFVAVVQKTGREHRHGMVWAALGLASTINMNKDNIEVVAYLSKAEAILSRIIELDDNKAPKDPAKQALPHMAMGLLKTAKPKALGGQPEIGKKHFERAIEVTDGKFLLAKVYYARGYARATLKRDLFNKLLTEVITTNPGIMPEQRLANEIAHRRARRYLKLERELF